MLDFTQGSSLQTIKTVLLTTVLLGTAQLLAGCDSQPANSNDNDNVAAQTDNIDKNMGLETIPHQGLPALCRSYVLHPAVRDRVFPEA